MGEYILEQHTVSSVKGEKDTLKAPHIKDEKMDVNSAHPYTQYTSWI